MQAASSPWLPLTFGGIAAFARASLFRLLAVEFVIGLVCAASVICLFYLGWEPPVHGAIARLPDAGALRGGILEWSGPSPERLAEGSFLSIVVDLFDTRELGHVGDVQLEFGERHLRIRSLFGYLSIPYPQSITISLNRMNVEPWWGAWHPVFAAMLGLFTIVMLFIAWSLLALLYMPMIRIIALFADRNITLAGAWQTACACLIPGALLMSAGVAAYACRQINLLQLLFVGAFHLAFAWPFVLLSPWRLPRLGDAMIASKNPFADPRMKLKIDE
ncbi:MAG: hypothetical protein FJ403_03515 [Verrucomicrobia bacterium]|nr:hypothetical protein [Verrucomicrobiota bacterium]